MLVHLKKDESSENSASKIAHNTGTESTKQFKIKINALNKNYNRANKKIKNC